MTADAFLRWAEAEEDRHELIEGEVVHVAGGTDAHARLIVRLGGLLDRQLEGGPCRVYNGDFAIRLDDRNVWRPDIVVACGGFERYATTEPYAVIEVLSPGTEAAWRGSRLARLQAMPSLAHIVLVAQDVRRLEPMARAGGWAPTELRRPGEALALPEIGARLALDEVYRGILA
jgi:Uma2 family endonuclease